MKSSYWIIHWALSYKLGWLSSYYIKVIKALSCIFIALVKILRWIKGNNIYVECYLQMLISAELVNVAGAWFKDL